MQTKEGLHILIISNPFPGVYQPLEGVFFRDQAFALAENGYRIGHISVNPLSIRDVIKKGTQGLGTYIFQEKGVSHIIHRYIHTPKNTLQPLKKALSKGKKLAEKYIAEYGKPDLIHVHRFEAGLLAMHLKNEFGIPYLVTEHSSRFLTGAVPKNQIPFAEKIFAQSHTNIAVSNHLKAKLEETFKLPFVFVPNLTDTSLFVLGKRPEKPRFISVGNLTENKNQILALEAFSLWMKENTYGGELVIIGSGAELSNLRKKAAELQIDRYVSFLGQIPREKLAEEMKQSTCLLITSFHETFGVVAIEALSSGIPVISTRCGGPESIIMEGKHGYFTSFSAHELAKKMQEVYANSEHFAAQSLRDYALGEFSGAAIISRLEKIYRQVLKSPGAGE